MTEKRVSVRLPAVGRRQVRAELEGVGEAGSRGIGAGISTCEEFDLWWAGLFGCSRRGLATNRFRASAGKHSVKDGDADRSRPRPGHSSGMALSIRGLLSSTA